MPHISFSEFKNWIQCPFYHKLVNIDKTKLFKGKLQSLKMFNFKGENVLHYDMNKSYRMEKILDLSGNENHGELVIGNGRVTKDDITKIPNTIVPDRRYGTM